MRFDLDGSSGGGLLGLEARNRERENREEARRHHKGTHPAGMRASGLVHQNPL
jgi:hypothetical protein